MKQLAEVTLCIPVYNAEKTITRTLESLIGQDYPIYKIKIFDNVSTDSTREICLGFSKRHPFIEFHQNEINIGAEANFTKCIMNTEGDYSAIVHADDIYESFFLSKSVAILNGAHDCVAAFCGALEMDTHENVTGTRFLPKELSDKDVSFLTKEELLSLVFKYGNFITCPSVVVRSNAYREKIINWNGGKYKTSADLDVWLRLSLLGKMASISTPLMKYRVADESFSYRIAKKRTTKHDLFLVLDQYKTKENSDDYYFLELKDQSLRSLNIIRGNLRENSFPNDIALNLSILVKKMLHSQWHFKMGLAILAINTAVMFLRLTRWNHQCKKQ